MMKKNIREVSKSPPSRESEQRRRPFDADESQQLAAELMRNGKPINWTYWKGRRVTPAQGARLAHFICPIEGPSHESLPRDLQIKIQLLEEWLEDRGNKFDLPSLVSLLGDYAHLNLRLAAMEKPEPKPHAGWTIRAREIADELFDRDTALGTRNTLKGYSAKVMEELQKRNVHGPRGRIDNPSTVMRDALSGDKWWKDKQK